jgi:hypothetical protein
MKSKFAIPIAAESQLAGAVGEHVVYAFPVRRSLQSGVGDISLSLAGSMYGVCVLWCYDVGGR